MLNSDQLVRMEALSRALSLHPTTSNSQAPQPSAEEVLKTAQAFLDFVNGAPAKGTAAA